jgi:DNA-binding protein HU-beta
MTKTEIIRNVASATGESIKTTETVVNSFLNQVAVALATDDKVQLIGFGTFEVRERKAKVGRNPRTGEEIEIAATKAPVFKAGALLKDAVR